MFNLLDYVRNSSKKNVRTTTTTTTTTAITTNKENNDNDDNDDLLANNTNNNNTNNNNNNSSLFVLSDLEELTQNMDRSVRRDLTAEIASTSQQSDAELGVVEEAIRVATEQHERALSNETFVRMRYDKYNQLLRNKRKQLNAAVGVLKKKEQQQQQQQQQQQEECNKDVDTLTVNTTLAADPVENCSYIDPLIQNEEGLSGTTDNEKQHQQDDNDNDNDIDNDDSSTDDDNDDDILSPSKINPIASSLASSSLASSSSSSSNSSHLQQERLYAKLEQEEGSLREVETTLRGLEHHRQTLEKRLALLERQRDEILGIRRQFEGFLVAAAMTEGKEEMGDQHDDENENENENDKQYGKGVDVSADHPCDENDDKNSTNKEMELLEEGKQTHEKDSLSN